MRSGGVSIGFVEMGTARFALPPKHLEIRHWRPGLGPGTRAEARAGKSCLSRRQVREGIRAGKREAP